MCGACVSAPAAMGKRTNERTFSLSRIYGALAPAHNDFSHYIIILIIYNYIFLNFIYLQNLSSQVSGNYGGRNMDTGVHFSDTDMAWCLGNIRYGSVHWILFHIARSK